MKLFGDQMTVKRWIIDRLPSDSCSINNALMIELSPVQSIIIDPQYQANAWLKSNSKTDDKIS